MRKLVCEFLQTCSDKRPEQGIFIVENFTGIAVLISAALATLGWYFSNRQAQLLSRRQHSFEVYNSYRLDPEYEKVRQHVKGLFRGNTIPKAGEPGRDHDIEQLDWLLGHYEFICATMMSGDVDERLMRRFEGTRICTLFEEAKVYIDEDRGLQNQPSMYCELESVARRWSGDLPNAFLRKPYEFFLLRPYAPNRWLEASQTNDSH